MPKLTSIYGTGDSATQILLRKLKPEGKWLILAAGDGRYVLSISKTASRIVATDIDPTELAKLKLQIPSPKIKTKKQDLTRRFPFSKQTFDGVLCTGTLHLFREKTLQRILQETLRVLKPGGHYVFDFAMDIRRTREGKRISYRKNEPNYTEHQARRLWKRLLKKTGHLIRTSSVRNQPVADPKGEYRFSCHFLLISGKKDYK